MKSVLIICSSFPPQQDVGGLRPAVFSKYFPAFGWRPVVLTRSYPIGDYLRKDTLDGFSGLPPNEDIICVEMNSEDDSGKLSNVWQKLYKFFCPELGVSWVLINSMCEAFIHSSHARDIDAIYATSPDIAAITVGAALANSLNVPFVADFRDIVEQDTHQSFRDRLVYYRYIFRRYWITRNASHVIVVSDEHKKILNKRVLPAVSVISNGYDPEMFDSTPTISSKKFTINYTGSIISKHLRDPSVFFEALDLLMDACDVDINDFVVSFVGSEKEVFNLMISPYKCKSFVTVVDRVGYSEIPRLISTACMNLVLTNRGAKGVMTTKFFEYLAVRRPILCVPGDGGELDEAIAKTKSGFSGSTPQDVYGYIKSVYVQWKTNEGVLPAIESVGIEQYSRKIMTKKLAALLDHSHESHQRRFEK
ncbi:MAG: glycosyltransferase [Gallionella sp.]|jgi:glycosyltransferase involved in cell wall biosynthesis